MEYLVTGRQAKAIDTYTIEHTGIPSLVLMERASLTIAEETAQVAAQLKLPAVRIAAVCGSGNNGGDGIAAARILHSRGYDITIFFAGLREKMSPYCQKQLSIAENLSVPISNDTDLDAYNIIIDAIFGIGLDRPVTGTYKDWITAVNSASENGSKVIAVDTPSGIHTDSGQIMGTAVHADRTVTFGYIKKGLVLYPGASCAGKVICSCKNHRSAIHHLYQRRLQTTSKTVCRLSQRNLRPCAGYRRQQEYGRRCLFFRTCCIQNGGRACHTLYSGE